MDSIDALNQQIVACRRCARLCEYRERVARDKRRAYADQVYWGRPIPGFGDPRAHILVIGLAPGAHGGNRTGRIFTGDGSGDFLFAALYRAGLANQPTSVRADDGLRLNDVYITATARCAPPENKLRPDEIANCREYLDRELALLPNVRVLVALGRVGFDACLDLLARRGVPVGKPRPAFAHARLYRLGDYALIASYHPSRRNTQTGLLTTAMFDRVFRQAVGARHRPTEQPMRTARH